MPDLDTVLKQLSRTIVEREKSKTFSFQEFMQLVAEQPDMMMRNVFQLFHDMVKTYVSEGQDEYPDDPDQPQGSALVVRTGEPVLAPDIPPEALESVARDERPERMRPHVDACVRGVQIVHETLLPDQHHHARREKQRRTQPVARRRDPYRAILGDAEGRVADQHLQGSELAQVGRRALP